MSSTTPTPPPASPSDRTASPSDRGEVVSRTALVGESKTSGEEPVSVRRSETQIRTTVTAVDLTQTVAVVGFFVLYGMALVLLEGHVPAVLDNALLVIVTVIVARRLPTGSAA